MTQVELAELAEVTPQAVSQWETGVYAPRTDNEEAIARALGISRKELLFGRLPRTKKRRKAS
jgi:transcriptional regulator with XRE-family HTH domain